MKITVLGSGLIGQNIIKDLAREDKYDLTAADLYKNRLDAVRSLPNVTCVQADLKDAARIRSLIKGCDLVISAVPGFMGFIC